MIRRAFQFVAETIRSIETILTHGNDVLGSVTLLRSAFELSARILWAAHWAAHKHDGWERFLAYSAKADQVWADEALKLKGWREVAAHVASAARQILARPGPSGAPVAPMPGEMKRILNEIQEREIASGNPPATTQDADFQYTNMYRIMCRPAHGNLFPVINGTTQPDERHVLAGTALTVWAMIRAASLVGAGDPKAEYEAANGVITKIVGAKAMAVDELPPSG